MFKRRTIHSLLILANIVYLQVVTCSMQGIYCVQINGMLLLQIDPSIQCYTGEHRRAAIIMWILLILLGVCYPLWCFFIVHRSFLKGATDDKRQGKYGYLYLGVRPKYYYFNVLSFVINFGFALQTTFATAFDTLIASASLVMNFLYVCASLVNQLETLLSLWSFGSYVTFGVVLAFVLTSFVVIVVVNTLRSCRGELHVPNNLDKQQSSLNEEVQLANSTTASANTAL